MNDFDAPRPALPARGAHYWSSAGRIWLRERPGDPSEPRVLLIHDILVDGFDFRGLERALGPADVLSVDLLGSGHSDRPAVQHADDYGPLWHARRLSELLGTRQGEDAPESAGRSWVLYGHGAGARVAAALTILQPDRVRALVLSGASPGAHPHAAVVAEPFSRPVGLMSGFLRRMGRGDPGPAQELLAQAAFGPGEVRAYLERCLSTPGLLDPELVDIFWGRLTQQGGFEALRATLRQLGDAPRFRWQELPREIPTLLLWGDQDRVVPVEEGLSLLSEIHHGQWELVDGAGHGPHRERPRAVASALRAFLSALS